MIMIRRGIGRGRGSGSSVLRTQWVIYCFLLLTAIVALTTEVIGVGDSISGAFDLYAIADIHSPIAQQQAPSSQQSPPPDPVVVAAAVVTPKTQQQQQQQQQQHRNHHCVNADFHPQHEVGVWTMLNDNMQYVKGAAKLGVGVRAKTETPLDLVVMELQSKPLSEATWTNILAPVGFIRCTVESIPAPRSTRADLKEKFAVLHVWAMEVYETVVFLDADTYAQNGIDELIHMDLQGKALGVTKDIRNKKWVETFNSGVMVLHPSLSEHKRLKELLYSGLEYDFVMSDQGFLNEVYKDNWHEIGFLNNANLALYRFQRAFWDQHDLKDINVIHYTMQKPWNCGIKGPYGPICKVWHDAK